AAGPAEIVNRPMQVYLGLEKGMNHVIARRQDCSHRPRSTRTQRGGRRAVAREPAYFREERRKRHASLTGAPSHGGGGNFQSRIIPQGKQQGVDQRKYRDIGLGRFLIEGRDGPLLGSAHRRFELRRSISRYRHSIQDGRGGDFRLQWSASLSASG